MELKMATTGISIGLQLLLNQVAYNKLINNKPFSKDGYKSLFSNSIFNFLEISKNLFKPLIS